MNQTVVEILKQVGNAKQWIWVIKRYGMDIKTVGVPGSYPPSRYYIKKAVDTKK